MLGWSFKTTDNALGWSFAHQDFTANVTLYSTIIQYLVSTVSLRSNPQERVAILSSYTQDKILIHKCVGELCSLVVW